MESYLVVIWNVIWIDVILEAMDSDTLPKMGGW